MRRNAARATAVAVAVALLALARLPELPEAERAALAARYAFTRLPLREVDGVPYQQRRVVNPAFERHVQWTSGLGAAVALADLDGDGLPNDVCHVDPRTDLVTIAPAPGTGERYPIFVLDAAPLPYDRATMAPTGCVPADLDEDGRLDLLVYYWGRTPVLFFQRAPADGGGLGRTHFVPRELLATGERWYTTAATFADLDGDGHVDLVVGNYFADGARVLDAHAPVADSMHHSWSRAYNGGRDRVFRWTAAGTTPARRSSTGRSKASSTSDSPSSGPWASAPPTSTVTSCRSCTSPTISVPIGCCTIAPCPDTFGSRSSRDGRRSPSRARRCSAATPSRAWGSISRTSTTTAGSTCS